MLAAPGGRWRWSARTPVAGTLLSLTGDLADANVRLQRAGVTRELRSLLRDVPGDGTALLEDVWTGAKRQIACAVLIDCGHRLPEEACTWPARGRRGPATAWPADRRRGDPRGPPAGSGRGGAENSTHPLNSPN